MLAFATTNDKSHCRICSPSLSFFEFEKRGRGWKLVACDISVIQERNWGIVSSDQLSVRPISDDRYGVFLKHTTTSNGITVSYLSLFARIADTFSQVLYVETGSELFDSFKGIIGYSEDEELESTALSWDSEYSIRPTEVGLYNLLIKRTGDVPKMVGNEEEYYFDGRWYVGSNSKMSN